MPTYMTYDEMVEFIKANPTVKVTHELFSPDEYIYADKYGRVYTEEDYLFENWNPLDNQHIGLRMRNEGLWQTGWYLWEEK